jgi:hypothetical protein
MPHAGRPHLPGVDGPVDRPAGPAAGGVGERPAPPSAGRVVGSPASSLLWAVTGRSAVAVERPRQDSVKAVRRRTDGRTAPMVSAPAVVERPATPPGARPRPLLRNRNSHRTHPSHIRPGYARRSVGTQGATVGSERSARSAREARRAGAASNAPVTRSTGVTAHGWLRARCGTGSCAITRPVTAMRRPPAAGAGGRGVPLPARRAGRARVEPRGERPCAAAAAVSSAHVKSSGQADRFACELTGSTSSGGGRRDRYVPNGGRPGACRGPANKSSTSTAEVPSVPRGSSPRAGFAGVTCGTSETLSASIAWSDDTVT